MYGVADGIATVTFNRPRVMNALDPATIVAFRAVCERAETGYMPRAWWYCAAPGPGVCGRRRCGLVQGESRGFFGSRSLPLAGGSARRHRRACGARANR